MTETTRFVSKGTATMLFLLVAAVVVLLTWAANERYQHEEQRGCMSDVVRPEAGDPDYDRLMLEFTSDVRGCLRG